MNWVFNVLIAASRALSLGVVLGILMLSSGCAVPKNSCGLFLTSCPEVPTAVLPMHVSRNIDEKRYSPDELRGLGELALETLTSSESDHLMGPGMVKAVLDGRRLPDPREWTLGRHALQASTNTQAELRNLSEILGVDQAVRSSLSVRQIVPATELIGAARGLGVGWGERITVQMDLIDLRNARILRRATSDGSAGGGAGLTFLFTMPVPYYFESTVDTGIEQVCRSALEKLFAPNGEDETARRADAVFME